MGVKIGRIHLQPRGVSSRRCGLLPNYWNTLILGAGYEIIIIFAAQLTTDCKIPCIKYYHNVRSQNQLATKRKVQFCYSINKIFKQVTRWVAKVTWNNVKATLQLPARPSLLSISSAGVTGQTTRTTT